LTPARIGAWLLAAALLYPSLAAAQESKIASDFRREKEQIAESCDEFAPKALGGCAYTLLTSSPLHITLGNLAPQNGFAFGLAFAERFTPNESWRLSWNADAVSTASGSWRAGAYMKMIRTPETSGVSVSPGGTGGTTATIMPREFPVYDIVLQSISLKTLSFYGIGPDSRREDRSIYGEGQTIVGGSALYPLGFKALAPLRPSLVGGIHGRFIDIRAGQSGDYPSIGTQFDDQSAPGLRQQDGFAEFTEGIRFKPSVANGALHFNYLLSAQQFLTSTASHGSFNRWTADLRHEIPLYRRTPSQGPRSFNGPNECSTSTGSASCPPVQWSRNRQGTITVRLLVIGSGTSGDNRVPFYLQPTLGGSDLNGERLLAGYDDYRFRGPNLIAVQEGIEHSLWGPVGLFFMAEHGKVAEKSGDLGFNDLSHSATIGLTLRAGGFPMVNLVFAFGGEANHVITSMNNTLLGGSSRPSLY
jgi:hypothetical protein